MATANAGKSQIPKSKSQRKNRKSPTRKQIEKAAQEICDVAHKVGARSGGSSWAEIYGKEPRRYTDYSSTLVTQFEAIALWHIIELRKAVAK